MAAGKKGALPKIITVRGYAKKKKVSPLKVVLIIVGILAALYILWAAVISTLL